MFFKKQLFQTNDLLIVENETLRAERNGTALPIGRFLFFRRFKIHLGSNAKAFDTFCMTHGIKTLLDSKIGRAHV